eukprot:evm.model.NODE_32765_length_12168_cov_16.377300.2
MSAAFPAATAADSVAAVAIAVAASKAVAVVAGATATTVAAAEDVTSRDTHTAHRDCHPPLPSLSSRV